MNGVPIADGSGDNNGSGSPSDKSIASQEPSVPDPLANVKPPDALLAIYLQQADTVFRPYAQTHGMTLHESERRTDRKSTCTEFALEEALCSSPTSLYCCPCAI